MKYGIISDIHSNYEALNTVLKNMGKVDQVICLGDIVGYGPNPNKCIEKIRKLKSLCIAGNHDLAVINELDKFYFNIEARNAIQWTKKILKIGNIQYLEGLKNEITLSCKIKIAHGSPGQYRWEYIIDKSFAAMIFNAFKFNVLFIGHSHLAGCFIFQKKRRKIEYIELKYGGYILLSENNRYIINCGSVGQPRDGNPQASYGIFDNVKNKVIVKRINYPILLTQKKILDAGLPRIFAYRLKIGR